MSRRTTKTFKSITFTLVAMIVCSSCSGIKLQSVDQAIEGGYDILQYNGRYKCKELLDAARRDECLDQFKITYDEYTKQRTRQ